VGARSEHLPHIGEHPGIPLKPRLAIENLIELPV
jgi:hypothetical protein